MAGVRKIVGLDNGGQEPPADPLVEETSLEDDALQEPDSSDWDGVEEFEIPSRWPTVVRILAILTFLCWTGFFLWVHRADLQSGVSPAEASEWIVQWSVPSALICVCYLLAMRNSTREARRFGIVAQSMGEESQLLEDRLLRINNELSLAREFLSNQSHELDALGRTSSERLTAYADSIRSAIGDSDERMRAIGEVSDNTLSNMDRIRGQLPVVSSSAKDVTNQIGNAGRVAQTHVENMIQGFKRINDFGQACNQQIAELKERTDFAIGELEGAADRVSTSLLGDLEKLSADSTALCQQVGDTSKAAIDEFRNGGEEALSQLGANAEKVTSQITANYTQLSSDAERIRHSIDGEMESLNANISTHSTDAINRINEASNELLNSVETRFETLKCEESARIEQQDDQYRAMMESITNLGQLLEDTKQASSQSVDSQVLAFEDGMARISVSRESEDQALRKMVHGLDELIDHVSGKIELLDEDGGSKTAKIAFALNALSSNLEQIEDGLDQSTTSTQSLHERFEGLLLRLETTREHVSSAWPETLENIDTHISVQEDKLAGITNIIEGLAAQGQHFASSLHEAQQAMDRQIDQLATLGDSTGHSLAGQNADVEKMLKSLSEARRVSTELAEETNSRLLSELEALRDETRTTTEATRNAIAESITASVSQLGEQSEEALERVLRGKSSEMVGKLEAAVNQAVGAANHATVHLRDQLVKVDELASNLERRVAQARENAEEEIDNSFARRVGLITESLNSTAIDVAKIMSNDVTDTAWAAYLKGDRGVFTRRAVRLLDSGEVREVLAHYDNEPEFREHVNRYIHDFESMLRSILSTRDGGSIGVTLLSSDMGKLYVALAQAIERLRS